MLRKDYGYTVEILTGVLCFLNIIDMVLKVKDKLTTKEDKQALSAFLSSIADLLSDVASDLEKNQYPYQKCSMMFGYLNDMKEHLRGKLDADKIDELHKLIEDSFRVEQLFMELNKLSADQKEFNINALKSASGRFAAFSGMIKL